MKPSRFSSITLAASLVLLAGCSPAPTPTPAPKPTPVQSSSETPSITPSANEPKHPWTNEQILTCTVSECWQLANKSEDTFFDIVQQLAAMSASNRHLTLPENAEAGKKAGEFIKAKAKADHDQLLYAIVDEAVRKVGTPEADATK